MPKGADEVVIVHRLEFIANAPALEILKLNNNGMGPQGGEMIAGALLDNAKKAEKEGKKSSLKVLVCGQSPLSFIFFDSSLTQFDPMHYYT